MNQPSSGLGWKLFIALAVFVAGNGTSYLAFGLHDVTREDFNTARQATDAKLDAQNDEIEALRQEVNNLVVELRVRKEIEVTR